MSSGVRITAGTLKGQRLKVPAGVRPTSQRTREALFSRWQQRIVGARLLDLFAGSGAVGLEAASRGAASVGCVEVAPNVLRQLARACARLAGGVVTVRRAELPGDLRRVTSGERYDLIFADPPYAFDDWEALLTAVDELLLPGGEVAVEHAARVELPESVGRLERSGERRYGDSCLSFYGQAAARQAAPRK